MADQPYLQAKAVSKIYNGRHGAGLHYVDLTVNQGKITAIIGESGSGKSTLLKLFYGLLSPKSGEITFNGEHLNGPDEKLIPGHESMKMVTQHTDDLNLHASVYDNVAVLLPNTNIALKEFRTEEILKQLKMWYLHDKRVAELSGGEKQRVAIARALVTKPEVLFLDEPFNQVDTTFREGLQRDIRQIVNDTGLTVLMVSHDPGEVLSMADHLVVLRNGEVVEAGDPQHLYTNPENFYTANLLSNCNVIEAEDARTLGIKTNLIKVVIYPEWLGVDTSFGSKKWMITSVIFKGPYEELALIRAGVEVRLYTTEHGKYPVGKKINIKVNRYLVF